MQDAFHRGNMTGQNSIPGLSAIREDASRFHNFKERKKSRPLGLSRAGERERERERARERRFNRALSAVTISSRPLEKARNIVNERKAL